MSYSKIFLALLITFPTFSSFSMDILSEFKYSNPYFDPKLQKTLTLIMLKNREQEPFNQNPDVLRIIAQNSYDLHCSELFKSKVDNYDQSFEKFWESRLNNINDKKRINTCYGQEIKMNDFDFITMNDQGRKIFLTALSVCQNDYTYNYSSQHIVRFNQGRIEWHKERIEKSFFFDQDEYKKTVQLPLQLRSKLGNLSQMIIIGEEEFSFKNAAFEAGCFEVAGGVYLSLLSTIPISFITGNAKIIIPALIFSGFYGIGAHHIQKKYKSFPGPNILLAKLFSLENEQLLAREQLNKSFQLIKKPLVPEKYAETLALKEQAEQEFQRSKKNILKHQQKITHKLLTYE